MNTTGAVTCTLCAQGHWCSADTQIPCSENTYNAKLGAYLVTDCTRCPERTSTRRLSGATSVAGCSCSINFYLAPAGADLSGKSECVDRCCTCPIGSSCADEGLLPITLTDLPVQAGFYRLSSNQSDVRRCPDAAANCPLGQLICANSTSGCHGGRDATNLCSPGLNGTFCRSCMRPFEYYVPAEKGQGAQCVPCDQAVSRGFSTGGGVALTALAFIVILGILVRRLKGAASIRIRLERIWNYITVTISVPSKIKILIGFCNPSSAQTPLSFSSLCALLTEPAVPCSWQLAVEQI